MNIRLGDDAPDFTAETTHGTISFHEWLGNGWGILFSHPKDFTPFCTGDPNMVDRLQHELRKRNSKVVGVSVDSSRPGTTRSGDIEETARSAPSLPLILDPERNVSRLYGMTHPVDRKSASVRSVFFVGPDKKLKLNYAYPRSNGRDFDEILRGIDSLQPALEGSRNRSWSAGLSMSAARRRAVASAVRSPSR
jgi:thioredoxin-dependent peroxiredoxin